MNSFMTQLTEKILITGDQGQLGLCMQTALADRTIINGSDELLDITDRETCLAILNRANPSVVINAAAYTAVDLAEQQQQQAYAVNADGPELLAQWCQHNEATLIHVSTDYVFSGNRELFNAYLESDSVAPVSVYGKSKLQGENAIMASGARHIILRTAWLYGANRNNFLKTMLRLTLANPGKTFNVVNDQYGSPTSTDALARQIVALLDHSEAITDDRFTGVYHATSSAYCSWYEFACEFFRLMGVEHKLVPCTTEEYPTAAVRPKNSILKNQRLKDAGVDCFESWQADLAAFVDRYGDQLLAEFTQESPG